MYFKRITSEGLAHHSYFICDNHEAVVIDPRRDIDVYLDLATAQEARIVKVFETHRNEDYAIGSTALREFTGAEILHGKNLDFGYGTSIHEDDTFQIGAMKFRVLETPGHTPESLSLAVSDTSFADEPVMCFTGDNLFVGDTGRTDLWGDKGEAAARLHESLFNKILPLGDHVIMYPAHGGGSVCGGSIASRNQSTLGYERKFSKKLRHADKNSFVEMKAGEKHVQPPYFKLMEEWNKEGTAPVHRAPPAISPLHLEEFRRLVDDDLFLVDFRQPQAFASAHIKGSLNIWAGGLSAYFGWFAPLDRKVLVILPEGAKVENFTRQLYRIGFDNVAGYLEGGFSSWQNKGLPVSSFGTVSVEQVREMKKKDAVILDVRKPGEWEEGVIEGSERIFVGDLPEKLDTLDKSRTYISMCAVGHRGGIAASLLAKAGFQSVFNFLGGYNAWKNSP